jgi:hypothetical protein
VNEPDDAKAILSTIDFASGDAELLDLERQFNDLTADLINVQRMDDDLASGPVLRCSRRPLDRSGARDGDSGWTKEAELILERLYPIERAIMEMRAHTIAGLGVKARHAAYVISQYWDVPIDKIDWDAQTIRLLIEAVCDFASKPLPSPDFKGSERGASCR